ncbi:MAG TPA: hypothetical protein VFO65_10435 [Acidimicrobiales bacterium]|nr:hypothetical protein [Acidimicrobiales bacterium]
MVGAVVIVVLIVLVLPPLFLVSGGILSALMGRLLRVDAEDRHEGSELTPLYD